MWLLFRPYYKICHILFCPVLFTLSIVDFQDKIELAIPLSLFFYSLCGLGTATAAGEKYMINRKLAIFFYPREESDSREERVSQMEEAALLSVDMYRRIM